MKGVGCRVWGVKIRVYIRAQRAVVRTDAPLERPNLVQGFGFGIQDSGYRGQKLGLKV